MTPFVTAALLLLGAPGGASLEPEAAQVRASALAQELDRTRDREQAVTLLLEAEELLPQLGEVAALGASVERSMGRKELAGEPAAMCRSSAAAAPPRAGRHERAAALSPRDLDLGTSFAVVGPLNYKVTDRCGGGRIPSLSSEPGSPWRFFRDLSPSGRLDLDDLVSDRRDTSAVVAFQRAIAARPRGRRSTTAPQDPPQSP